MRSKSCYLQLCIALLTFETVMGASAGSLRVRRQDNPGDEESKGRRPPPVASGSNQGETSEDERGGSKEDDNENEDEKPEDGWWNTTFGVLMYFIMVLFFALQVTLLIFCLGIFIRNVCCGNRSQTSASATTSPAGGQSNLGHTPDAPTVPLDEESKLIIQHLKDTNNEKVTLLFEASPDTPIVNNWVGDASPGDAETLDRPSSRVSTTTLDSNVSVITPKHASKWICSICLSPKTTCLNSLPCMHAFHKTCLHDFVLYSLEHNMAVKCPICRCKVKVNLTLK